MNLYYSDDFFKTKKLALNNGNSIIKTDYYMFIAKATKAETVEIFVSTVLHGFTNFERTRMPTEAISSRTFTVMDTSEETVFLHIQNRGAGLPLGNIYMSDGSGKFYTLSVDNVLRGSELVDFEKVNSLEGVFLANKFEVADKSERLGQLKKNINGTKQFTKADIDAAGIAQTKMNQAGQGGMNKKQKQTKDAVRKEMAGEDEGLKDIENNIRTYITHNKGGKWELIRAPTIDSEGKKVNCYMDEGCSLHL